MSLITEPVVRRNSSLKNKLYNRLFVPGFMVNSLPKSGTHLLIKALNLFPGIRIAEEENISAYYINTLAKVSDPGENPIYIGVDYPRAANRKGTEKFFSSLKSRKHIFNTHSPYSEDLADLFRKYQVKSLTILRDPRDVVVSHAKYLGTNPAHFFYPVYKDLTTEERIKKSIIGIPKVDESTPFLLDLHTRCKNIYRWKEEAFNYTTYFEKLIGQRGGGTIETQKQELKNIADHLNIKYNESDISFVIENLFGGTATFDKGEIGTWKKSFTPEHKDIFKNIAGQVLIDWGYEKDLNW